MPFGLLGCLRVYRELWSGAVGGLLRAFTSGTCVFLEIGSEMLRCKKAHSDNAIAFLLRKIAPVLKGLPFTTKAQSAQRIALLFTFRLMAVLGGLCVFVAYVRGSIAGHSLAMLFL